VKTAVQGGGGLMLGGVSLGFGQERILLAYKILVGCYLGFFYFTARAATFEALFCALLLIVAAFLPGYLWCSGKAKGLPIVPALALFFIPTYALPVQTASKVLASYTPEEQAEGILYATGYLLLITLFWHQMCNRESRPQKFCYMIDPAKSVNWMIFILFAYLGLQLLGKNLPQGLFTLLRGILMNGTALACFILSFYAGQGKLRPLAKGMFFGLLAASILLEAASLILASSLVRLAVVMAGYGMGSGKIPWKGASFLVAVIWLLHAGKSQMREEYWQEGVMGTTRAEIWDYPAVFGRWIELGLENTFNKTELNEGDQTAAERGSLLNVFLKIKSQTPSKIPYLEGLTYQEIPKLLVPRFLNKEKGFSHIGNMWLAYLYGFTSEENISRVSIGFDLMMEGYANFGVIGVITIAILIGVFLGWVGRISMGVPLMSFRFFFAILVLNTYLATNNTMGVFITTLWQGSIGMILLSFIMMKKLPNPLFVSSGQNREFKRPDLVEGKKREAGREVEDRRWEIGPLKPAPAHPSKSLREIEGKRFRAGIEDRETEDREPRTEDSGLPSSNSGNPSAAQPGAAQVRHERPTRFVYEKQKRSSSTD